MSPRELAIHALLQMWNKRIPLSRVLATHEGKLNQRDHAFAQQLCFGLCRHYYSLEAIKNHLVKTRIKARYLDIQLIVLLGLYQLIHLRIPEYAAVTESVKLASRRRKPWAKGLINGILREFIRHKDDVFESIAHDEIAHYEHPEWLINTFKQAWPDHYESILYENNQHPPQILRVNRRRLTRDDYLQQLKEQNIEAQPIQHSPVGVRLDPPRPSYDIPGYDEGWVSIQDGAPQLGAYLMQLKPGLSVLDACAAPGGKTAHMLETEPDLAEIVALDRDPQRVNKIHDNLQRLGLKANVGVANALRPDRWWDGQQFDRILLDVPCSTTGVIRRHPDIKLLRAPYEIQQMAEEQRQFLDTLWPLLKPGGILLYATCSLIPTENAELVDQFLRTTPDAKAFSIEAEWGIQQNVGRQILPNPEQDGFYYARLQKRA